MISFRVRAGLVVVVDPLTRDVALMPVAEQDELVQALVFDGLDESLYPTVHW